MGVDQLILQKIHTLPPKKQYEVLDFVEFLASRLEAHQALALSVKPRRRPPSGLKGKINIRGDIVSPVVTEEEWDALR